MATSEMLPQLWMLTSASGMPGPKVLLSESSLADSAKMVPVVSQVRFSSTRAEARCAMDVSLHRRSGGHTLGLR